jgi:hypothetical protein
MPKGDEAGDGSSDPGAQDRGHHFDALEEGRTFRRRTTENASSLSIEQNPVIFQGFHASVVATSVRAMLWFEGEYLYTH